MNEAIQLLGLTSKELTDGTLQYHLLASSNGKMHDYTLTPIMGRYHCKISPTVIQEIQFKPRCHTVLTWNRQGDLIANTPDNTYTLFQTQSGSVHIDTRIFEEKPVYTKKHHILVIHGNPDDVMPFLDHTKTIAFAKDWDKAPSFIPEDIVVIDDSQFTVEDLAIKLPKNVTISSVVLQKIELDNS